MITSIHTLIYSDDAQATRAFLRDVLGWKYVAEDWANDWLIFKSGRGLNSKASGNGCEATAGLSKPESRRAS